MLYQRPQSMPKVPLDVVLASGKFKQIKGCELPISSPLATWLGIAEPASGQGRT